MSSLKKLSPSKGVTTKVARLVKTEIEESSEKKRKEVKNEQDDDTTVKKSKKTSSASSTVKSEGGGSKGKAVCYIDKPVTRKNGVFSFPSPDNASEEDIECVSKFHPNKSPEEVLRAGSFGGTYFRTIRSGVLQETLSGAWKELPKEWIQGLEPGTYLSRPWKQYDTSINKFGVKAGTTLEDWESSGWITPLDPFGWFQWYCRFFQGRRSWDDARQIDRWLKCCGPTGRWKGNLCGKVVLADSTYDDPSISPVVRQTLLHWGYELTEKDYEEVRKRLNKGKGAYFINKDQLNAAIKQKNAKK